MPTRTDVHSPTNMDPAAYEYIYAYDSGHPGCLVDIMSSDEGRAWWGEIQRNMDGDSNRCAHCGVNIRYIAILRHIPTGRYIRVGETCVDNRFSLATKRDFDRLRKAAEIDRAKQRIRTAVADRMATMEQPAYWLMASDAIWTGGRPWGDGAEPVTYSHALLQATRDHHIVADVRGKFQRYGELSPRQEAMVTRAYTEGWAAPKVPVEGPKRVDAPLGRVRFTGQIVHAKIQDGGFGPTYKMLVIVPKDDGVYSVWATIPNAMWKLCPPNADSDWLKEAKPTVEMTATLSVRDDSTFASGKIPTIHAIKETPVES